MKKFLLIGFLAALFIAACWFFTIEGANALAFGWLPFSLRVLPRVTVYWPSVVVGATAFALFIGGVHWLGRSSYSGKDGSSHRVWRFRWAVALVLLVVVSFAAGISIIGVTHQIGWLASTDRPFYGEHLSSYFGEDPGNNMKQIVLGINSYNSKKLPPAASLSSSGEPLHSWETHILGFIGISSRGIDKKLPWNAPENQKYFKCVIPVFINPGFRTPPLEDEEQYGLNHFSANSQLIKSSQSLGERDISDGTSKTILLGEVNVGFSPWGRPMNVRDPAVGINRGSEGFGGPDGTKGATFSMADGSARFIREDVDPAVLKALSTPADGESLPSDF